MNKGYRARNLKWIGFRANGTQIIGELMKPSSQWGPACREHHDKFIDNIQTCDTLKQENERNGGLFQSGTRSSSSSSSPVASHKRYS